MQQDIEWTDRGSIATLRPPSNAIGLGPARRLGAIVSHLSKRQVEGYIAGTAAKAFSAVTAELAKRDGLDALIEEVDGGRPLRIVRCGAGTDFVHTVRPVGHPIPTFALSNAARREGEKRRFYRAQVLLMQGGREYDIFGYTSTQVIANVINHCDRFRHYLISSSAS